MIAERPPGGGDTQASAIDAQRGPLGQDILLDILNRPAAVGITPNLGVSDRCNLRAWFAGFLLWLATLTALADWGLGATATTWGGTLAESIGPAVWLVSIYAFYLSLCCTFVPAPTTWIVMLVASDMATQQLGMPENRALRLFITATVGALATGLANLNEYHLFTFLLRYRRVRGIKETRLYRSAANWFSTSPFLTLVGISLVPIPVDVVRWLAIAYRYPRFRFFWGYFIGRWFRYALWAVAVMGFRLETWHIAAIQGGLVLAVAVRIGVHAVKKRWGLRSVTAAASPAQLARQRST